MELVKKKRDKIKEIAKQENCKRIELCCWSFNQNAERFTGIRLQGTKSYS